jgi:hypothetical protein
LHVIPKKSIDDFEFGITYEPSCMLYQRKVLIGKEFWAIVVQKKIFKLEIIRMLTIDRDNGC